MENENNKSFIKIEDDNITTNYQGINEVVVKAENITLNTEEKETFTLKDLKEKVIQELINNTLYTEDYENRVELLKIILDSEK